MILETTNPKYKTRPQIPARAKFYMTGVDRPLDDFSSQGSRDWAKGRASTEQFQDRKPHEKPFREPEPKSRPAGMSLWVTDEAHDAPLWWIKDRHTGHILVRVRGSLPWVVDQLRLAAHQLGGQEKDLYFQRARER